MKFTTFLFMVAFAVCVGQMGVLAKDCFGTPCDEPCECVVDKCDCSYVGAPALVRRRGYSPSGHP